jgi:hypothetical protein
VAAGERRMLNQAGHFVTAPTGLSLEPGRVGAPTVEPVGLASANSSLQAHASAGSAWRDSCPCTLAHAGAPTGEKPAT